MSVIDNLRKLSSAEDFFSYLRVSYDPKVLRVARLHIMRRMGERMAGHVHDETSDEEAWARYRQHLAAAYDEFSQHAPLEQRVFKVLKDAVSPARLGLVQLKVPHG